MPAWLVPILLRFGIPFALDLLRKKFGLGVQNQVVDALVEHAEETRKLKSETGEKLRRRNGIGSPPDLVE